jgi:hypothetical protein
VQLKGKQRLLLVALAVIVLVGGLALAGTRLSRSGKPSGTPVVASNINGGTTATPEEVSLLKSYGLVPGEVPLGAQLRVSEERRNYAMAPGSTKGEIAIAQKGRIDGYYQMWVQTTDRIQIETTSDLFNSPSSAMSIFAEAANAAPSPDVESLPNPKLGDQSRMSSFTASQAGQGYEGWAVQWVRGRAVLGIQALAPPGVLHAEDVLNAAHRIDDRAQKAPIK